MEKYTVKNFVANYSQKERGQGEFELENERILEVNLNGDVWMKMGSMISYRGNVKFSREGILERGLGTLLKRTVTGEGGQLTKASGVGKVYIADQGKKITVLKLQGDSVCVNGKDLLALQTSVDYEIKMMKRIGGVLAGGLFNVRLGGHGMIAIGTHYDPIVLEVTPDCPLVTDPNATVAWSGTLEPEMKLDASFKTFLGRGSGESVQMRFVGMGFVVIQPVEEVAQETA
jgi:uncharacterized protein (AIM24 family)